ncbi:MAG TPA: SpoIID/LytB domain-containing protein [Proteiniphilum sp.]|nr:SpoIID/LytB domain-containing protein [Proteiniphilum sp.]HPJ49218.1 SpoIID/LytB domain-containing protein [Proteiniphilum sp.]
MGTTGTKEIERSEPLIAVGILPEQAAISFSLLSGYTLNGKPLPAGDYRVEAGAAGVTFQGEQYPELTFEPEEMHRESFELKEVVIGLNFHWERRENQRFQGALKFIAEEKGITAINIVALEDYLKSVISSEMSATSSKELLKAHAVISRSWLLAQMEKNKAIDAGYQTSFVTPTEIIRWYDREEHARYDVCADDHCQRYQGITRQTTGLVNKVIDETRGAVITYRHAICDARFSKCCGGVMERFENVWEPIVHPYLQGKADWTEGAAFPDLTQEEQADEWIRTAPPAYCNTQDATILRQVLNDYDRETADFYRWKVVYTQEELSTLIRERSGIDYGEIIELEPLERGSSGRIIRLKIIGTEQVMTIGKELEIRRTLSPSHLYSSAFVVDAEEEDSEGTPQRFTLTGAGWGHGVGLCQIGAAMMAAKGQDHKAILRHYFPHTTIEKRY